MQSHQQPVHSKPKAPHASADALPTGAAAAAVSACEQPKSGAEAHATTPAAAVEVKRVVPKNWTDGFVLAALKTPVRSIRSKARGCCADDVVAARLNESLAQVFQRLVDHNISGMPVLTGAAGSAGEAYAYIGLEDLVARVVGLFPDTEPAKPSLEQLFAKTDKFAATTVRESLRAEAMSPVGFVPSDASVWFAVEEMTRHKRYRVAAATSTECVTHIVTQSMCIAWLAAGIDALLPDAQNVRICDVKLKAQPLVVLQRTDPALAGFRLMHHHGFTGLPVVDATGVLVDFLSVRDLKCITPTAELLHRVLEPADAFKADVRKAYPQRATANPSGLFLLPTDSLKCAIVRMASHRVHHLPIVNDPTARRVEGQLSQSDILSFLVAASSFEA